MRLKKGEVKPRGWETDSRLRARNHVVFSSHCGDAATQSHKVERTGSSSSRRGGSKVQPSVHTLPAVKFTADSDSLETAVVTPVTAVPLCSSPIDL